MTILENYLKSKKVRNTLSKKPGEEGFSLVELVVVIAVLAILSAVAIPAFVGVQANARASAVKNGLVNGIKECVVSAADNGPTLFASAVSYSDEDAFQGYLIKKKDDNDTCYSAWADAVTGTVDADFKIEMNTSTGRVTKWCSNASLAGCDGTGTNAGTW